MPFSRQSTTPRERLYVDDRNTKKQFAHYFTSFGSLENEMFSLQIDEIDLVSRCTPARHARHH